LTNVYLDEGSVSKMAGKMRTKNWLSVGKIGEYCLVSTATVRRWIKNGELSAIRLPSGHYRVSIADFRDFLKQHNMPIKDELYEMSELEAKFFEAVRHNESGATLIELAERLDVAPVVIGRAAKYLLDAGRIRKEGSRYYLANSGTS
jgi:excisionase family DNA binding protein